MLSHVESFLLKLSHVESLFLQLHPDYDPRKERATLLRLSDLSSPGANRNSSYSYLISLGKGESLSSMLNNVVDQNDPPGEKVPDCDV